MVRLIRRIRERRRVGGRERGILRIRERRRVGGSEGEKGLGESGRGGERD